MTRKAMKVTDVINLKDAKPTLNNVILDPIKKNLVEGDCHNQLVVGKPFIGKSNMSLVECLRIDPTFKENLQTRFAFTIPQVIAAQKEKTDLPYRAIMFDEIGDPLGNRSSMSAEQRRYVVLKQADRIRSIFMPQTITYAMMADKGIRMLSHSIAEGVTKNKQKREVKFKYKENTWKVNYKTKEPIFRFPMVKTDGKIKRVTAIWVGKAPSKEWHLYSKLKIENLDRITNKVLDIDSATREVLSDQIILETMKKIILDAPEQYISQNGTRKYLDKATFRKALIDRNMAVGKERMEDLRHIIEKEMSIGYMLNRDGSPSIISNILKK